MKSPSLRRRPRSIRRMSISPGRSGHTGLRSPLWPPRWTASSIRLLRFRCRKRAGSVGAEDRRERAGAGVVGETGGGPDGGGARRAAGGAGLFGGGGPGAGRGSRRVLGVGVPQATAGPDAAAARDEYHRRTGRYVPVVADGGIAVGGDVAKALAFGADAGMLGSAPAPAEEAPGRGIHRGMAAPHAP